MKLENLNKDKESYKSSLFSFMAISFSFICLFLVPYLILILLSIFSKQYLMLYSLVFQIIVPCRLFFLELLKKISILLEMLIKEYWNCKNKNVRQENKEKV